MKINKEKHGTQLTLGKLANFIETISKQHKNWRDIPIYLGDDDELNGVHCAWYTNYIPTADIDMENNRWRDIIFENCSNIQLDDDEVGVLIS